MPGNCPTPLSVENKRQFFPMESHGISPCIFDPVDFGKLDLCGTMMTAPVLRVRTSIPAIFTGGKAMVGFSEAAGQPGTGFCHHVVLAAAECCDL